MIGLKLQSSAPSFEEFNAKSKKLEEEKKLARKQKLKAKKMEDSSDERDFDSEDEEGQIAIPKDVIVSIEQLIENESYLVCYIRRKSEEEA